MCPTAAIWCAMPASARSTISSPRRSGSAVCSWSPARCRPSAWRCCAPPSTPWWSIRPSWRRPHSCGSWSPRWRPGRLCAASASFMPPRPRCSRAPRPSRPNSSRLMNNADLIVATLKAAGIDRGFGIPSGNVLPLMEAMRAGGIEFVLTAHEGSAGFAADVTGRMTGVPGLCIATLGPGATNLATGVGCAHLDRSPLIAITCNLNTDQLGRRIQMWIDHHALFKPITKATLQLRKGEIGATLAAAIALALSEPQGPVHLDLPEDVALAPTNEPVPALAAATKPAPAAEAAVERAAELIDAARRPVAG